MQYRNYAEIRQLYEVEGTDAQLFRNIIAKIYPALLNYNFESVEAVLFTRPLNDFVLDYEKYKKRIESYISENYSSVLIKKHPREDGKYNFGDAVTTVEIDNSIPAEAILPYLSGQDIVIITTSSVMFSLNSFGLNCKIILFEGLYEESLKSRTNFRPPSIDEEKKYCKTYADGCYEIVQL
jgi:hypothetical protein